MEYSAVYRRSRPAQYQPWCGPTGPALRLILGWPLASIHGLVRHPWLVLYIYFTLVSFLLYLQHCITLLEFELIFH